MSLTGKTVGNYHVTRLLGEGGMGKVYLARHPKIGLEVAIKVLAPEVARDPRAIQRFEAEAQAVAMIKHPNIIDVYDFGQLPDGSCYFVMEYLEGCELSRLGQRKGAMTTADAWPYVQQLCGALQAAHDRGVVHRDLKPDNIFLVDRPTLTLKVLDFGLAKMLERESGIALTNAGTAMGTPLFISPEQAAGRLDQISATSDIYSLGVILYWLLSGKYPFMSDTPALLLAMHLSDLPPPLQSQRGSIPAEICELVHLCLEKDPHDRPASAKDVRDRYSAALKGAGVQPGAPETPRDLFAIRAPLADANPYGHTADGSLGVPRSPLGAGITGQEATLAPWSDSTMGLSPPANTLDGAAAEISVGNATPSRTSPSWLRWLGIAALVAGLGSLGVFGLLQDPPTASPGDKPSLAASPAAATSAAAENNPPAPFRIAIKFPAGLPTNDIACALRVGDRLVNKRAPCEFHSLEGNAKLTISLRDTAIHSEEWHLTADRTINVNVVIPRAPQSPATRPQTSAPSPEAAVVKASPKTTASKTKRKSTRPAPLERRRTTHPDKPSTSKAATAKKRRIGQGVLDPYAD